MKSLWFVSSLFLISTSCNNFVCNTIQTGPKAGPGLMTGYLDTAGVIRFKTSLSYKSLTITGLFICKAINDSTLAGTLLNEFGIRLFDFTLSGNRARLDNVFKKLDRWYIRRLLEADLQFLFSRPKAETACTLNNSPVYVESVSRNLHYVYYRTGDAGDERADRYRGSGIDASMQRTYTRLNGLVLKLSHADGSVNYEFSQIIH